MDNDAYMEYINQEVRALNNKVRALHKIRPENGFKYGCPRCGTYCEHMGGNEGECDNCQFCRTDVKDGFNRSM